MSKVFLLDTNYKPLNPIHPAKARQYLRNRKAVIYKQFPFTLILKASCTEAEIQPLKLKIDPGAKFTGIALVDDNSGDVVWAAQLQHRGFAIRDSLTSSRQLPRSRRNRKTRYRQPRFLNRTGPKGWLPPSLQSRVANIETWVKRLQKVANIQAISFELVRFDMQKMRNRDIQGKEYQQGTLVGYETREYAYCGAKDVPLEIEHIHPKSKGGSNAVTNLTLSCHKCNTAKSTQDIKDFLKDKSRLAKILKQAKKPLADAAFVNVTRWALFTILKETGLPIEIGSGGLTKFNRCQQNLPKTHWFDAACVGESTPTLKIKGVKPLLITANGHGTRQMCRTDKYGFPCRYVPRFKFVKGFQTGDIVKAVVTKGKKIGTYTGRIAVRTSGSFNIYTKNGLIQGISYKYCQHIHKKDGYSYVP